MNSLKQDIIIYTVYLICVFYIWKIGPNKNKMLLAPPAGIIVI